MKKRIISAILMAVICIPLIFIGGLPLRIGVGLLSILAYKEVIELKGIKNYPASVVVSGLLIMILLVFSNRDAVYDIIGLDYRFIAGTFLALLLPTIFFYGTDKYTTRDAFFLSGFILFLGVTLNIITNIIIYDRNYFFLILAITILTDTFAYFTGMAIGRHKVTKISPNKSLEGFIGGLVMGTVIPVIIYKFFIGSAPLYTVIPVVLVLSLVSILGDLFYSAIKREWGIKDFSKLIPGHGGILDRIDSLTFVTIAYVILRSFI